MMFHLCKYDLLVSAQLTQLPDDWLIKSHYILIVFQGPGDTPTYWVLAKYEENSEDGYCLKDPCLDEESTS